MKRIKTVHWLQLTLTLLVLLVISMLLGSSIVQGNMAIKLLCSGVSIALALLGAVYLEAVLYLIPSFLLYRVEPSPRVEKELQSSLTMGQALNSYRSVLIDYISQCNAFTDKGCVQTADAAIALLRTRLNQKATSVPSGDD